MSMESDGGMIWQEKTEELGEKPVPVPLCPPQIPHGLNRERTRASALRGRRLTTWAMARPQSILSIMFPFSPCFRRSVNPLKPKSKSKSLCYWRSDSQSVLVSGRRLWLTTKLRVLSCGLVFVKSHIFTYYNLQISQYIQFCYVQYIYMVSVSPGLCLSLTYVLTAG
jgi:hypothetical protein